MVVNSNQASRKSNENESTSMNVRDPPDKKSVYILPGDPEKETYRLSTYLKFPALAPVDPCVLARYGFSYTGYKDRVKCFSCGALVQDWCINDNPKLARWHLNGCELVLGKDKSNKPIQNIHPLEFVGTFTSSIPSLDSGYASSFGSTAISSSSSFGSTKSSIPSSASSVPLFPSYPTRIHEDLALAPVTTSQHRALLTEILDLHQEADRIKSFETWKCPAVSKEDLAKSGFFYLGFLDRCQCFSCFGVLHNWRFGDDVHQIHKSCFQGCKMANNREHRNIPLSTTVNGDTTSRPIVLVEPPDPTPEEKLRLADLFPCKNPMNPHMSNPETRFLTFAERWPAHKVLASTEHIAKAGFFFLGERDRAKCWYCNGGLQNWDPTDEPFTEHAKWFPGCEYLLRCKGVDFVKNIVEKFPNLKRPTLRNPCFDHKSGQLVNDQLYVSLMIREALELGCANDKVQRALRTFQRKGKAPSCLDDLLNAIFSLPAQPPPQASATYEPAHSSPNWCLPIVVNELSLTSANQGHTPSLQTNECPFLSTGFTSMSQFPNAELAQQALEQGYSNAEIQWAVAKKIKRTGKGFESLRQMIRALHQQRETILNEPQPNNEDALSSSSHLFTPPLSPTPSASPLPPELPPDSSDVVFVQNTAPRDHSSNHQNPDNRSSNTNRVNVFFAKNATVKIVELGLQLMKDSDQ